MSFGAAVARLACVLAGVGLATTRLGLVAHELIGHGGVAIAFGGRVLDVRLFWFAGGWIRYDLPSKSVSEQLVISLGGIALEIVVGLAMWLAIRRATLGARIARATGGAIAIHGAWYLAVGTFHGFGDGWLVRRELGDARVAVACAAGAVVVVLAFVVARSILGALAATIPGGPGAKIGGIAVAAVLAGGLQVGLALGELEVRRDRTYGAIMEREDKRIVARELAAWERQQRGVVDPAARKARERALVEQHREFPFGIVLGVLAALAVVAGAWRARPSGDTAIAPRLVLAIVCTAVASVALVIALDVAFV